MQYLYTSVFFVLCTGLLALEGVVVTMHGSWLLTPVMLLLLLHQLLLIKPLCLLLRTLSGVLPGLLRGAACPPS